MRSGPFPDLPKDSSALVTLVATGISGADGSFPVNSAGDNLPPTLMFNTKYVQSTLLFTATASCTSAYLLMGKQMGDNRRHA